MQQEIVDQHQATSAVAAQLGEASGLDPEALAALPEDMRREVIEQEQQQQRLREHAAADPANAEEMDNASFVASLAPDLREEILLTADDTFLNSLPPDIIAEAQILRERANTQQRRRIEETANAATLTGVGGAGAGQAAAQPAAANNQEGPGTSRSRRQRNGKIRVEVNRPNIVYMPETVEDSLGPFLTVEAVKSLIRLLYLLSPVTPQQVLKKLLFNICLHAKSREVCLDAFVALLNEDKASALVAVDSLDGSSKVDQSASGGGPGQVTDNFPPFTLIGTTPSILDDASGVNALIFCNNSAAAVAASLPASARGSSYDEAIPPVVVRRIISLLSYLSKSSPRICTSMLSNFFADSDQKAESCSKATCFERLLDLLDMPLYSKSSTNLELLLSLLESIVAPLSLLTSDSEQVVDISSDRSSPGKEWKVVPRVLLSKRRLHLLCSVLRLESCKEASFTKVSTLIRRIGRVQANREIVLGQLALVSQAVGADAIRDLKSLGVRLSAAAKLREEYQPQVGALVESTAEGANKPNTSSSSAVFLSTSTSELKLLWVLQTLHNLCVEHSNDDNKRNGDVNALPEFVSFLQRLDLDSLWDQLTACLRTVSVLEGVANAADSEEINIDEEDGTTEENEVTDASAGKKLQNSVAGLITRFLPTIEAFFVVNGSFAMDENKQKAKKQASGIATSDSDEKIDESFSSAKSSVIGNRLVNFVASNKVLLNALLRSNPNLLEKGLRPMVQVPRCRPFLDFDNKRHYFKNQVRRLRQQASRRHGSLRLNLRRKHVFEDAYHAFIHRNSEELRGRLHITFQNEEGVDAGGLSREFFAILAKEMFNPNYALFMSTEDGCTFQPNPNSSINPEDIRYFRFVGRIVGKAVIDGFLLDAHFTRSLYKHMLGVKPSHHDMQAIDPDYYKNLQMILEHNLAHLSLDLTFSTEDYTFGRKTTRDLIPNGRNIPVTEETKAKYVDLVCQHRITTAIEKQIKAFLEGFHELVERDLISIFTAKELELLISGMPDIDIHDLKSNTEYNGYRPADKEIGWFWNIMFTLSRSEKAAFLQFVTGSSKVPLSGFSELQGMRGVQKFSINKASGPSGALMSAHTCFNALDLPVYTSEEEMKNKLLYAISEGGGGFLFA